jgi:LPS export ABC transporter protein LptC
MNTVLLRTTLALAVLAASPSWVGCDSQRGTKSDQSTVDDSARLPDSELRGATISLYEGSNLTTGIKADRILKYEPQDSAIAYQLKIKFYDSTGAVTSDLVGDSGLVREEKGLFEIYGNVVAVSVDQQTKLETDYLKWNPEINRIQTDAFVKITKGSDVITGWGLETDRRLSRIKILRQVSGTVSESTTIR